MNDMSAVIVPKSDQINAEDFLAGPQVFTIDSVSISPGTEQPVSIRLAGEKRVWRPCKSMSRVLVSAWGPDASLYVGRSVRLFCDANVTWGGMKVGGIRISHMTHIERDMVIALTATKGKKVMATIKPLVMEQAQSAALTLDQARADMQAADTLDALKVVWTRKAMAPHRDALAGLLEERKAVLAFDAGDGPADSQRGEPHTQTAYAAAIEEINACPTADAVDAAVDRLRPEMETDDEAADLFNHAQATKQAKGWA